MRKYSLTIRKDTMLIDEARVFFEKQRRFGSGAINHFADEKEWIWDSAYTVSVAGKHGIIIPLLNGKAVLGMFGQIHTEVNILVSANYSGQFNSELIRLAPDSPGNFGSFTGYLMPGHSMPRVLTPAPLKSTSMRLQHGIVHSSITMTKVDCDNEEKKAPPEDEVSFTLIGDHNGIGNIKDYCKCFDNNPGSDHIYEVMLCVSQPIPNSREPWGLSKRQHSETGNPICVGHTFLVLKEKTPNKTVVRNIGFYPSGSVWPYDPADQGELVNNSYHDYNISLTITVTSSEFTSILNFICQGNDKGFMYNLNSNNCTTFALNALGVANIRITRTTGHWKGGSGCNPGDLGEDLRVMQLSSNMKLGTVYVAHGNQGDCI